MPTPDKSTPQASSGAPATERAVPEPRPDEAPRRSSAQWAGFWKARGWQVPSNADWPSVRDDPRLLHYAAAMCDKFGFVRFIGLPTQGGPEDTPLDRLFVQPDLSNSRIEASSDPAKWPQRTSLVDAIADHPRLVILGDPGTGKSTLVSWIVLSLLATRRTELIDAVGPLVPIVFVLRDLAISSVVSFDALVDAYLQTPPGSLLGGRGALIELMNSGRAIVLIDGLDEAGGTQTRRHIAAAIQEGFQRFSTVRWVATSRIVGYDDASLSFADELERSDPNQWPSPLDTRMDDVYSFYRDAFRVDRKRRNVFRHVKATVASTLYVAPFDDKRIALFVRNWHEQHETDRSERGKRAAELIDAVHKSDQIEALSRIPNLLTMIALVYRVYARLPDGRALLYERIAQAYLETIDTARKLPTLGHTLEDMKRWLGYVAFKMQQQRFHESAYRATIRAHVVEPETDQDGGIVIHRDALERDLRFAMAKGREQDLGKWAETASAFVDWVARRAGLIIPRTDHLFAFSHLSFQEYFAAWFIAEQVTGPTWGRVGRTPPPLAAGTDPEALWKFASDARWHETFLLLFELLAVRGDWSDEFANQVFRNVLDETASNASPGSWLTEAQLLVRCARDVHSGLSVEMRETCIQSGWRIGCELATAESVTGRYNFWTSQSAGFLKFLLDEDDHDALEAIAAAKRMGPKLTLQALLLHGHSIRSVERVLGEPELLHDVRTLDLTESSVSTGTLARLGSRGSPLKRLRRLGLGSTSLVNDDLMALLVPGDGLETLEALDIEGTHIDDEGLMVFARPDCVPARNLRELDISGARMSDRAILEWKDAGALPRLEQVVAWNIRLGSAGLLGLLLRSSAGGALRRLFVSGASFDRAVIRAIRSSTEPHSLEEFGVLEVERSLELGETIVSSPSVFGKLQRLVVAGALSPAAMARAIAQPSSCLSFLEEVYIGSTKTAERRAAIDVLLSPSSSLRNLRRIGGLLNSTAEDAAEVRAKYPHIEFF